MNHNTSKDYIEVLQPILDDYSSYVLVKFSDEQNETLNIINIKYNAYVMISDDDIARVVVDVLLKLNYRVLTSSEYHKIIKEGKIEKPKPKDWSNYLEND